MPWLYRARWLAKPGPESRSKPGSNRKAIMIGASHSHSSGPVGMVMPGEYDHASDLVRGPRVQQVLVRGRGLSRESDGSDRGCGDCGAFDALRRTLGFWCRERDGRSPSIGRIKMKTGLAFSHPGKGNPDNVEFAGPTDPDVGVIGAWNPDGKLLGCVVNFACHATTNGPWITANWPYYMERAIQGYFGPETKVVLPARRVRRRDAGEQSRSACESRWRRLGAIRRWPRGRGSSQDAARNVADAHGGCAYRHPPKSLVDPAPQTGSGTPGGSPRTRGEAGERTPAPTGSGRKKRCSSMR
jgi:hypothetical protein